MFGKKDLLEDLSRDLDRARGKRDTLASDVTTLTTRIAELESRLSEEKERRERERLGGEIEEIKKRLEDSATAFAPVIAGLCDATETAATVVLEARELNSFLKQAANEVNTVIDLVLRELHRRAEAVRAGHVAPHLAELVKSVAERPKNNDLPLLLPTRNNEVQKSEAAEDRGSTAA
jgi:predicted  nucleic acid-binding Zn-ribbon protein